MSHVPSILILSSGALCRNPRVLKEASALGAAGFEVTVLTLAESADFEAQDRELLAAAPFRKLALGTGRSGGWTRGVRFTHRLASWLARKAVPFGIESRLALGTSHGLAQRARRFQSDLAIVHNELPHWIGARLLKGGRRVAADIEDWHSEDLGVAERARRPLRLLRASEATLLRQARYCTTTSHALAGALAVRYGAPRPIVITNSFPLQLRVDRDSAHPPSLFWFSQTIGPGRGLEPFVAAWAQTQAPSRLVLLGNARAGFVEDLRRTLPSAKQPSLQQRSIVPPGALPALIAGHDIGLALEPAHPRNKDLTISNKILQYLNAGLAVLATGTAGQREVLANAPGAGLIVDLDDPAALIEQLDMLLRDRARIERMGTAARAAAERTYCWEREAPRLVSAVETALRP